MVKQSNIHHISVHVAKSTIMVSVPDTTTLPELRAQVLTGLAPLASHLPSPPPTSAVDIQLWEDRAVEGGEGDQGVRALVDEDAAEETIQGLGWGRWKRLFVSFRAPDGTFPEPQATVPHPLDGDDEEEPDQ